MNLNLYRSFYSVPTRIESSSTPLTLPIETLRTATNLNHSRRHYSTQNVTQNSSYTYQPEFINCFVQSNNYFQWNPCNHSQYVYLPEESVRDKNLVENIEVKEDFAIALIQNYFAFRNDIRVFKGKVNSLATTQTGSRFLQKELKDSNLDFVSFILEEVKDNLGDLMVDDYGNYLCQKLIASCSALQRVSFLFKVMFIC